MATKKSTKATIAYEDRDQFAVVRITQTGVDTTTNEQFPTSQTIRDKVGILISRIEVHFLAVDITALNAAGDAVQAYVFQLLNNVPIGTDPWPMGGIFFREISHPGAAVSVINQDGHIDWTPVEPILVHPASLFAGIASTGTGLACDATFRITFKYVELEDADYQDLFQTIIAQNVF